MNLVKPKWYTMMCGSLEGSELSTEWTRGVDLIGIEHRICYLVFQDQVKWLVAIAVARISKGRIR